MVKVVNIKNVSVCFKEIGFLVSNLHLGRETINYEGKIIKDLELYPNSSVENPIFDEANFDDYFNTFGYFTGEKANLTVIDFNNGYYMEDKICHKIFELAFLKSQKYFNIIKTRRGYNMTGLYTPELPNGNYGNFNILNNNQCCIGMFSKYNVNNEEFIYKNGASYFEYPQFCAELIKECHSFPNGIDSKGSYYLVKCIEEVHYKPDPSPFWDSWSVPQLAIKAASINNVMEKVQSIVNRWMDIQVRSPSNARYDLSYITHIFKVEDHLGKILHKKDIHDICSLYP